MNVIEGLEHATYLPDLNESSNHFSTWSNHNRFRRYCAVYELGTLRIPLISP
jgi:hypothetical protein